MMPVSAPPTAAPPSVANPPAAKGGRRARPRPRRFLRTPVVPQMEDQDCAAACLAIVLGAFGRRVPLHEAARACGVSRDGASAAAVVRAARGYGMLGRGRRIPRGEDRALGLSAIPVPAMVLVRGPHFAVYEGMRRGRVRVNDPSIGRYGSSPEEFWDVFSGVAVGFAPGPGFTRSGQRFEFFSSLVGRARPYLGPLLIAVAAALLVTAPGVLGSLLLRAYVTNVSGGGEGFGGALAVAAGVAAASVFLGTWLQQLILARVLAVMSSRTSARFLWRMLRLPGTFFHRRQLGGLVTRVQLNDGLAVLLSGRLTAAASAVCTAAGYLSALIWLDAPLAAIPITVAVLDLAALRAVARRRSNLLHGLHTAQARRDAVAFAGVAAIETLKAEGSEDAFFRGWAAWQARVLNVSQSIASATQTLLALPTILNTAAAGLTVILGMRQLEHGAVGYGTLLAFLMLTDGFLLPVGALVGIGSELLTARAQTALLRDVEEAEPDPYLQPVLEPVDEGSRLLGGLELRGITFGYDTNRAPLFDRLSLSIRPGEWVAVVGASGSGKSTLARLGTGVLRPWSGEVLFDGRPRDEVPRAVLTGSVGYVEQQLRLFAGTFRDNISLWGPPGNDQRLWQALRDAEAADLVASRGGLDAPCVDEDARNLSGGERQRIELARALALDPAVLVLDEASSALDAQTEARVAENLRGRGCTCLILAHRLSTVRLADRVVVLDQGRIVQEGRHEELAAADGPYRRLVEDLT